MNISDVLGIVSLVVGFLVLLPLIAGAVFVVVVVANRADPDPSGRRPALVYAMGTSFLTLFTTLFALTAMVAALCQLIGSHGEDFGGGGAHQHPLGDSVARSAVLAGLVALIAGVVCAFHLRASARASADATTADPLARVRSSYGAAVAFVSVLLVVIATVIVLYDIFRIASPGVFTTSGHGGRVEVLRSMIPALFLALGALAILLAHLRHAPPPFRTGLADRWFGGSGPTAATEPGPAPVLSTPPVAPVFTPPPAPETEVLTSPTSRTTAPRKAAPRKAAPRKAAPRKTSGGGS